MDQPFMRVQTLIRLVEKIHDKFQLDPSMKGHGDISTHIPRNHRY